MSSGSRLERAIFLLVAATFCNIYLTQPILPVLERTFDTDAPSVARTFSAVLLGIALANLPFGYLGDRVRIRVLLLTGLLVIVVAGIACASVERLEHLVALRFVQGLFIPALSTCLAAYLAKTLPPEKLAPAMGAYVAATVAGGLGGRLIGGVLHAPENRRASFITAAALLTVAGLWALRQIPDVTHTTGTAHRDQRYTALLAQPMVLALIACALVGQAVFTPIFTTITYRLSAAPFDFSVRAASWIYLVYLAGVVMGPAAGRVSQRLGPGPAMMLGAAVLALSVVLLLPDTLPTTILALLGICAGFFGLHAAAVGALNRRVSAGQARANALYVLAYYVGAAAGAQWAAAVYAQSGWDSVVWIAAALTVVPLAVGWLELRASGRVPG